MRNLTDAYPKWIFDQNDGERYEVVGVAELNGGEVIQILRRIADDDERFQIPRRSKGDRHGKMREA